MPNVYKPNLIQIRPQYTVDIDTDVTPENVLWLNCGTAGPYTTVQLSSVCEVFDPLWGNIWKEVGPPDKAYTGSIATDWTSDTGVLFNSVGTITPQVGIAGGVSCPYQVAMLISISTGQRYRGGHGRVYLPYVSIDALVSSSEDKVTTGVVASVNSALGAFHTGMTTSSVLGGLQPCIYRHRTNEISAQLVPWLIWGGNQLLATQRRRIRKVTRR